MSPVPFFVTFSGPAAPANFVATAVSLGLDPGVSSVSLVWTPVSTAPANFVRYEVWAWDDEEDMHLIDFTDPAVSQYVHHFPRSGKLTTYGVRQITRSGVDEVVGNWAHDDLTVILNHTSLISTVTPFDLRVPFSYWTSKRLVLLQTQDWQLPAGGRRYKELSGSIRSKEIPFSAQVTDDQPTAGVKAAEVIKEFEELFNTLPPHPFCLRDQRGRKIFGRFNGNVTINDLAGGIRSTVDATVREISFTEGVS